jgi:hypothetical protein
MASVIRSNDLVGAKVGLIELMASRAAPSRAAECDGGRSAVPVDIHDISVAITSRWADNPALDDGDLMSPFDDLARTIAMSGVGACRGEPIARCSSSGATWAAFHLRGGVANVIVAATICEGLFSIDSLWSQSAYLCRKVLAAEPSPPATIEVTLHFARVRLSGAHLTEGLQMAREFKPETDGVEMSELADG